MNFFIELLHSIWDKIKKILVKILNFAKNIVSFFKNPSRLKKLKEEETILATSIKENLDNGEYRVVNCLFDQGTNEIIDMEETQGIQAENIDEETEKAFGDKPMIVLN